jgi:hypothetical protein
MFKVKEFKEESEDDGKVIWTSEKVDKLLQAMEEGYQPPEHPFYEGDPNYKRGNVVFEYTDFEFEEIKRCAKDIIYFANTYCQVMTDEGYQKIVLRPYQERVLKSYQSNRWNIFLAPRQVGKTITSSIFLTWFLLFHFDKNVLLMSNKGGTTKEIMDKIKAVVEGLPFFLKPGVQKKDVMTMIFDNRCRIIGQNTTKTGGIGFTIHLLFLDEFAHIPENIKKPFYENVYPTLSSSAISRVIITSTPNGYDLFYDLYQGAVDGMNEYTPIRVDWWEVPGRDEAWKNREIANLGSEEAFNQQYGCQFLNSSSLLLSSEHILRLESEQREFIFQEIDDLDDLFIDYSHLKWDPDFDLSEIDDPKNFFLFSVDLAEGIGRDYSIINIFKIRNLPNSDIEKLVSPGNMSEFFGIEQIGIFRSNLHNLDDFSKILYTLCVKVFNQENLRMVIEYNTYGSELIKNLISLYPASNDFDEETIVRYKHRIGSKVKNLGIRINKENKILYCEKMKKCIGLGQILIKDKKTIDEAKSFSRNNNGTYSAQSGNDDCIMTCVTASSFFDTVDYVEIVEEFFDFIDTDTQKLIDRMIESSDSGDSGAYDYIFSDGHSAPLISVDQDIYNKK